jgi:hypothetical protein
MTIAKQRVCDIRTLRNASHALQTYNTTPVPNDNMSNDNTHDTPNEGRAILRRPASPLRKIALACHVGVSKLSKITSLCPTTTFPKRSPSARTCKCKGYAREARISRILCFAITMDKLSGILMPNILKFSLVVVTRYFS